MTATVTKFPRPEHARIGCLACGASLAAACDCGVTYAPNAKQKRTAVAKAIKENPEKSDRQIGKAAGVDHKTIAAVRADLESNGEIPHKKEREEEGGRKARGRKPAADKPAADKSDDDDSDSEEVCWRRGLLYRATNAAGEAAYEDWSQFRVDSELVAAATRAAERWNQLAAYLKELHDGQIKTPAA